MEGGDHRGSSCLGLRKALVHCLDIFVCAHKNLGLTPTIAPFECSLRTECSGEHTYEW